jgi:hypothetical protein
MRGVSVCALEGFMSVAEEYPEFCSVKMNLRGFS